MIYLHVGLLGVHELLDDFAQSLCDGHVAWASPCSAALSGVWVPVALRGEAFILGEGLVQRARSLHIL